MSGRLRRAKLYDSNQVALSGLRLAAGRNQYTLPLSDVLSSFDHLSSTSLKLAREYRNDLVAARVQCIDLEYHRSRRDVAADVADRCRPLLQEADGRRTECYFVLRSKLGLSAHDYDMTQALEDLLEYERVSDIRRTINGTVGSQKVA